MDEQRRRGSRRSAVGSTTSVLSIRGDPRGKGRGIRGPHAFATDPGSPQDTRQEADQEADEEVRLHPAPLAGCQMNRMAARVGRIRAVPGDSGSGGSELGFDGITGDPAETVLEFVGGGQHDCGPLRMGAGARPGMECWLWAGPARCGFPGPRGSPGGVAIRSRFTEFGVPRGT